MSIPIAVEYHGPVIYRDGAVDMVLFPGGYATVSGGVTFHYYTQDYLGNNRAVVNGSTGAIEQLIAYYPYGGVIADLGTPTSGQPYKFGGKELMTANGLNEYDFGARQYYTAIPGFTRIDPMAEKYPWLSPYLYCADNPVNAFDPDGNIVIFVNGFHGGSGGSSKYWGNIDTQIMNMVGDNLALYLDGAMGGITGLGNFVDFVSHSQSNLDVNDRISAGFEKGYEKCQMILDVADATQTTVKFVSHSMGSAFTKGLIQGMRQYAEDNKTDIEGKLDFEVDFAQYQPAEQKPVLSKTIVIQHFYDVVAGDSNMLDAFCYVSNKELKYNLFNLIPKMLQQHSITSFWEDLTKYLEPQIAK